MTSTDLATTETAPAPAGPKWKQTLEQAMPSIQASLPRHVTPDKFRQVAASAIGSTPMLRQCMESNPRAVLTALSRCAADGLLPDNRLAALVPFRTKNGVELTYIPMIAGVLQRMRNSGEVESVRARIVHANDAFEIVYGDDERFVHKPAKSDRGAPVGAYAIISFKDGEVYREWMDAAEIQKVKNASRAKGGPWSGPFELEMWRKTVLKRAAKYCPFSEDVREMLDRDNAFYDPEAAAPEHRTLLERLSESDERPPRDVNEASGTDETDGTGEAAGVVDGEAEVVETERDASVVTASNSASPDKQGEQTPAGAPEDDAGAEPPAGTEAPAHGDESGADDDAQPASVQRFYADTLAQLKAATTAGQRTDALKGARANALWDHLTAGQQAEIAKAAG